MCQVSTRRRREMLFGMTGRTMRELRESGVHDLINAHVQCTRMPVGTVAKSTWPTWRIVGEHAVQAVIKRRPSARVAARSDYHASCFHRRGDVGYTGVVAHYKLCFGHQRGETTQRRLASKIEGSSARRCRDARGQDAFSATARDRDLPAIVGE